MATNNRTRLIRLIHVAKRELQMDDTTYRAALQDETGKTSSAKMSIAQMEQVLKRFKSKGFRIKRQGKAVPQDEPTTRKMRSLWHQLHDAGLVRTNTRAAMLIWIKRETKVDNPNWLNSQQASQVIEQMKQWLTRKPTTEA